ncbi:MAG: methylthioribulose 1-phosphate dehydratase [Planctomycetes bacterium]|nr:methylthioribulose 1-phosphate dehydratase [Planctomycetota bacterium]
MADDVLSELAVEAKRLVALGFLACTAGNLSARLSEGVVAMSPSGVDKGTLTAEDFIQVDDAGAPIPPDRRKPSDETALHLALYGDGAGAAICHGHPPYAVALSMGAASSIRFHGIEMQKAFAGITTHEHECLLPVIDNSQDMAELSRRALAARRRDMPAVLVRGHGVYAWGRTVREAGRHLEAVEWLCRIVHLCGNGDARR